MIEIFSRVFTNATKVRSLVAFLGQYLTSSSVFSFVTLDFFLVSLEGSSFLQAAREKVTLIKKITMKIGNDNFMIGSFPIETGLLLWNPYECIIAHMKSLVD